jgi:hypothetical protein
MSDIRIATRFIRGQHWTIAKLSILSSRIHASVIVVVIYYESARTNGIRADTRKTQDWGM